MKQEFFAALSLLSFAAVASAHFVWVLPDPGGSAIQVFLSEELKPAGEVDVSIIGNVKLTLRDAKGRETPLTLKQGEDGAPEHDSTPSY